MSKYHPIQELTSEVMLFTRSSIVNLYQAKNFIISHLRNYVSFLVLFYFQSFQMIVFCIIPELFLFC